MNFNTRETLIGLQWLGLDLETGKSTEIFVKELEDLTLTRLYTFACTFFNIHSRSLQGLISNNKNK